MHAILVTPTPSLLPETHGPIAATGHVVLDYRGWSMLTLARSYVFTIRLSLPAIATSPLTQPELLLGNFPWNSVY
jgi:hypothetical protein